MKRERVHDLADYEITKAAKKRALDANDRVCELRDKEHIGKEEAIEAVQEANSWIDFIAGKYKGEVYFEKLKYRVIENAKGLEIIQGAVVGE